MNLKDIEVKDLFNVVSGSTPSTTIDEYWDNGKIKWITPKDLSGLETPYIESTERNITELGLKNCSANLIPSNSIIISSRAPIGYVAILKDDMACNQGCKALVPKYGNVDSLYAYYLLSTKVDEMNRLGSGSTFKEISKSKIESIKISLPDLKTQQKIASILEQADAARQKRKQANQLTEQFLQSAFLEMFGDPVRNEKEWEVKSIGDVTESHDYKRVPVESSIREGKRGEFPYYGASGIIDYVDEYIFDYQTLLIGEDGANLLMRSTPIAFIASGKYWVNNHAHVLVPKSSLDILYLMFFFNSISLKPYLTGSAQPKLNASNLNRILVPIPPLSQQQKFAALVEQVERLRTKQRESERELDNLFQSLMQKYFG